MVHWGLEGEPITYLDRYSLIREGEEASVPGESRFQIGVGDPHEVFSHPEASPGTPKRERAAHEKDRDICSSGDARP
jgi:hypothetical protein